MKKYFRIVSRFVIGIVFIFSGFVKGVDPLGTMYKMEDYFAAFNMLWAEPLALPLSVCLVVFEFMLGVMLILNIWPKLINWLVLLTMSFFTILTFNDALFNPVPDCGCFGDAIILTPWETFYKNVVLMFFVFVLMRTFKEIRSSWNQVAALSLTILFAGLFAGFSLTALYHLPSIDFRYWKEGKDLKLDNGESQVYLVYQNLESGEQLSFKSEDLPWQDSVWMAEWEFVEQKSEQSGETHDLQIIDAYGDDVTDFILLNSEYQFVICAYDLNKSKEKGLEKVFGFYKELKNENFNFILLTSSLQEEINSVYKKHEVNMDYGFSDDVTLKAMIRNNPGVLLLKDGVILKKWAYRDLPDPSDIKKQFGEK
ncbi:MAG: DoxX family protein [Bacteroidales bacterium]|nr:DoxX family protein [Bacteroidales bacterium]